MNPVSHPMPLGPKPMVDVVPPVTPSPPASPSRPANSVQAEIVGSVPVRQPSTPNPYNPISGTQHAPVEPVAVSGDDNELVNILKDINKEVKVKLGPAKKSRGPGVLAKSVVNLRKAKSSVPKPKKSDSNVVVIIATAVAAALIILAVFAFRQSQNGTALSRAHLAAVAQAKKLQAENKPAVFGASYLDSLSDSLQAEVSAVASNQDFDPAPLSDNALGL